MVKVLIRTKPGCLFCDRLKMALTELKVAYEEEVINSGVAPIMLVNGTVAYTGLPPYKELVEFCNENRLVGGINDGV